MTRLLLALSLIFAAGASTAAQDDLESAEAAAESFGLDVGATAPRFALDDQFGVVRTLADLAGPNGLVLFFNRSIDWCPYCLRQTLEIDSLQTGFADAGYGVAVLTYDAPEVNARVAERRDITLPLLSDPDSAMIDAFEVRDPMYPDPDSRAYGVPYPVAFVLAPDGRVKAKYWHEPGYGADGGYRERVETAAVIAALAGLE